MQSGTDDIAKQRLRRELRTRRAQFVAALPPAAAALAFRVLPRPLLDRIAPGSVVALYHAMGAESPTERLALRLDEQGYQLALPRMGAVPGSMNFALWSPDQILYPGPHRTLQPGPGAPVCTPDTIIAPLIGFDGTLARLGQGGGYYDRAFAAHPAALRIGLGWSVQMVDALPIESHDERLDMVLTEATLLERQRK